MVHGGSVGRQWRRWRQGRRWLPAAILAAALTTACTTSIGGVAERVPYRPLALESVTATMAAPVDGAVAYSQDGTVAAVKRADSQLCIVVAAGPAAQTAEAQTAETQSAEKQTAETQTVAGDTVAATTGTTRAGAVGAGGGTCVDLGTTIAQVLFSPDASTVAALEDVQQTRRSRLWLISVRDGSVREMPEPGSPLIIAGTAAAADGPAAGPSPSAAPALAHALYYSIAWTPEGSLVALALAAKDADDDHLVQIAPASGASVELADVTPDARIDGAPLVGGGIVLVPLAHSPAGQRWVLADLADRTSRVITLTGAAAGSDALPLAISPDGSYALAMLDDPASLDAPPV